MDGYTTDPEKPTSIQPTELAFDVPVMVANDNFGVKYLYVKLKEMERSSTSANSTQNICDVLMKMSRQYDRLPEKR